MKRGVLCLMAIGLMMQGFAQRANYEQAERFREMAEPPIAKLSTGIRPTFLKNSDKFWFEYRTEEGSKYYLVDPDKRRKTLLFDNATLLAKVSEITRKAYNTKSPGLFFEFEKDNETINFSLGSDKFTYNTRTQELRQAEKAKPTEFDPYWKYYSTDSLYMLFAKGANLYYVGNAAKGMDTTEVQLTRDGERHYSFAREEEGYSDKERAGCSARWFPTGHRFYAVRSDSRKVNDLWLIDALAKPRPTLKTYKAELAGDKNVIQYEIIIGDVKTGKITRVKADKWPDQYIDILYASKDGKRLYFQRYKRTWDEMDICVADAETGEVRELIHEVDKPYLDYQMRNVSILNDGADILFRSERSGWGHYYLYDGEGRLKNQITSGAWVAGPVMKIDTARREFYFIGLGKAEGVDPYYYVLYKASLDKPGNVQLLTPENATHNIAVSPSGKYIVDSYSRVDMEPVNVVRNAKGKVILELPRPDLRRLYELGWKAPERFKVKAADGVTDIYGVMYKPADFDSTRAYPIISTVYPGPFFEYVNTSFSVEDDENTRLAQLGFIVITTGHRGGTPMRGKFYHTYGYGNQRDYPLADDKYVIRQLAARYPWINEKKVGIYGHSGGGFMAAAALMTYPDFYSAAVSCAGNHDNNIYNKGFVEIHYGVKEEKKVVKDSVNGDRTEYTYSVRTKSNQELAKNYKGGLLLVVGDQDRTVHPAHSFRLANALIEAGKNFDMIVLPGSSHGFFGENGKFFERKMWFHFARHLLGDDSADYEGDLDYFMKRK